MNNRIKELQEKAKLHPYYSAQQEDIDRFAELLVKECISLIQNEMQGEDEISSEWVYNKIVSPTKQHFGIE